MTTPSPGDLVTFPLRGSMHGVAQLVHIDELPISNLYHFVIYDAVVEARDPGFNEFGDRLPREHDAEAIEGATPLIDHVGLTQGGLDASDLAVVGERDVDDELLNGYRAWLHLRYEDALRRGVLRDRVDDNPEHEEHGDEEDDENEGDEYEVVSDEEPAAGEDDADDEQPEAATLAVTFGIFDTALGDVLMKKRDEFQRDAFRDSAISRFILGLGEDTEAIDEIVARLFEGDFAAGEELIDFGEAGMRRLGERLDANVDPQTAEDALQVLVNSGEAVAYEHVGRFMAEHGSDPADPLYGAAVRAYCYAVMLTAGEPEPLKERLPLLESVSDPELAADVRSAREALAGEG